MSTRHGAGVLVIVHVSACVIFRGGILTDEDVSGRENTLRPMRMVKNHEAL